MIAPLQHFGNFQPTKYSRAGVMRPFQHALGVAVLVSRPARAQYAGDMPYYRVNHHHCRQFAAGEDIIADADLVCHYQLPHALVYPFVASA